MPTPDDTDAPKQMGDDSKRTHSAPPAIASIRSQTRTKADSRRMRTPDEELDGALPGRDRALARLTARLNAEGKARGSKRGKRNQKEATPSANPPVGRGSGDSHRPTHPRSDHVLHTEPASRLHAYGVRPKQSITERSTTVYQEPKESATDHES